MIKKAYQRRYLRAPLRESMLYADKDYVLKARVLNISEGGLLIDELPNFPETEEVPLIISIPQLPLLKNFSLIKMQTFSKELFQHHVIRAKARMTRRDELSQDLDNIFKCRFGLEFIRIYPLELKVIEEYVQTFAGNLIFLQTMIDSFNTDDETRHKVRTLANILGYQETEKIAELRSRVVNDYKSLQWL